MSALYRVKIKKNDFEIEVESSDKEFVENKLNEYVDGLNKNTPAKDFNHEEKSAVISNNDQKKLSINELLKKVNPKGGAQHVLLSTYYKEFYEDSSGVLSKDIADIFQVIRYKSTNISRDIAEARSSGFLMDGKAKKSFVVTNTGKNWIESKLNS